MADIVSTPFNIEDLDNITCDGCFGNHLERLYGLNENNRPESDLPEMELKTHYSKSTPLTLFTKEPDETIFTNSQLISCYGNKQGNFYCTLFFNKIWNNLTVVPDHSGIGVIDVKLNEVICYWKKDTLIKRIDQKIQTLMLYSIERNEGQFRYDKRVLYNNTSYEKFLEMIMGGAISIDFRMRVGKNRGTAFRIKKRYLSSMYSSHDVQMDGPPSSIHSKKCPETTIGNFFSENEFE